MSFKEMLLLPFQLVGVVLMFVFSILVYTLPLAIAIALGLAIFNWMVS